MNTRRAAAALAACVVTVLLLACSSAEAFTVELTGGHATVTAVSGEINAFTVEDLAGGIVISDVAENPVSSVPPPGCVVGLAWELLCQPGAVSSVAVDGGDGNDSVSNGSVLARVMLAGGSGNDQVSGGAE